MNNFAVLDIAYSPTLSSILITTTTNNPCHLTCYYTDKPPLRHKTSRRERGIDLPWGAYFCFVAWLSVEQIEAGDTLTHTFEIPDWSYCQTNWFVFRGTVNSLLSPSVSSIFEKHHPGVYGTRDFFVYQQAHYQCSRSANPGDPDLLYTLAHGQDNADHYFSPGAEYGQRIRKVGTYYQALIRRRAFTFRTNLLPPGTLISAQLRLDIRKTLPPPGFSNNFDWHLKIRAGQDLNSQITHPALINYSRILALGSEIGSKYADDLPDPGFQDYWYLNIPLSFINRDGLTVITSLTSKDETAIRPANNQIERALAVSNHFTKLSVAFYEH